MSVSVFGFRKIVICQFLFVFILTSSGCATIYPRGEGVVISEKKINQMNLKSGDNTISGSRMGGKAGVASGGIIGGSVGLLAGSLLHYSLPVIIISTAIGGVLGGGLLGLTGVALGGTVGYLGDLAVQNAPEYEFKIKPFNDPQIITIRQHAGGIPVNANVRILEKNGELFIKKIK